MGGQLNKDDDWQFHPYISAKDSIESVMKLLTDSIWIIFIRFLLSRDEESMKNDVI